MPKVKQPLTLADGNAAASDLADVTINAAGPLTVNATNRVTAAGTYSLPTPPAALTTPPQRVSMSNGSGKTVVVQVLNPSGSTVPVMIVNGAGSTWRAVQGSVIGWQLEEGKPQARLDERYRNEVEFWDRAQDHAPGSAGGEYALTGQVIVPQGYTTSSASDPAAFPKYIGTGTAARLTTDTNGSPLGVFSQAQLAGPVNFLRGRWTVNPNTTNGGSTAGTTDTGTVGLIAWAPGFNGNGSAPNVLSPCHLSINPGGWQYGVIYDPGNGTPTFAALVNYTYAGGIKLAQDGTTIHSCEVVIDANAPNNAGGRGVAYVYSPDGVVVRVDNNAIGVVPTATMAVFEVYKANSSQKLAEFVEMAADSRSTARLLRARREAAVPQSTTRTRLTCSSAGVTTTGTITKPSGAKTARVSIWAGGGGGGSGGIAAATAAQSGGGGGSGSSNVEAWIAADDLPATIPYQVGGGGAGGASKNGATTASGGNIGTGGSPSFLGSAISTYSAGVSGGNPGAASVGGTAAGGTATGGSNSGTVGTAGGAGANGAVGAAGGIGGLSRGAGGGGAGGGIAATTQAALAGGAGGYVSGNNTTAGGTSGSPAGGAGLSATTSTAGGPASGGGGGASQTSGSTAGNGGVGGFPGGGGGGGGTAAANGTTKSGAGGNGGDGLIVIDWFF